MLYSYNCGTLWRKEISCTRNLAKIIPALPVDPIQIQRSRLEKISGIDHHLPG
jgi:hypothetical protein